MTLFYTTHIDDEQAALDEQANIDDWRTLFDQNLISIHVDGNHMTLLQPPYVDSLAEKIVKVLEEQKKTVKKNRSVLTPLVKFSQDKRNAPKLICIPGWAAGVSPFIDLGLKLKDKLQLIVAQQRGMDLESVHYLTVEQAVEDYLDSIIKSDLDGPIHILGHSFGVRIAFELACRSKNVCNLTLI